MPVSDAELLAQLGRGVPIEEVCRTAGIDRQAFDAWWRDQCLRRLPPAGGASHVAGVQKEATIGRDRWGVLHITAENDADLMFAYGYATAQDRLFQLDYLRRKAQGRLAEVLGPEAVESDLLYRTLNLAAIAETEWGTLSAAVRELLSAYTAGINAYREECGERLPIEFDLLSYRPHPFSPLESLAIEGEFRWYLTGRFPVIVVPELVKRALGDGPLYAAFLQAEQDSESIMPPGSFPARPAGIEPVGTTISDRDEGHGSNNWVLAASRSTTGAPLVASDPHVPFGVASFWHEVHLRGGSFHVAGVAYVGVPAVMAGRTRRVAWGITNNICSQRDLYLEKTSPEHPGCFLYDGQWEPACKREESIDVRGAEPVVKTIVASRHGPLVDEVLPEQARDIGPVSLRWLGFEPCGWLTALLDMNRAASCDEFRQATRPWRVPTWNLVFADDAGHTGLQSVGRIPIRGVAERACRPGWEPKHQWQGVIPFDAMPALSDLERGYVVTANNRLAPDDFPYPLSGTWSSGYRGARIRVQLEAQERHGVEDSRRLQMDTLSGRAADCVPALVAVLAGDDAADARARQAADLLARWDRRSETDSVGAALFNVFFAAWCRVVAAERLPAATAEFVAGSAAGLAASLLRGETADWFVRQDRDSAIRQTFRAALDELANRLGPDPECWTWGRLHTLVHKHPLSGRGELSALLDCSGAPVRGDGTTVCSSSPDAGLAAYMGASYRMVADLGDPQRGLWSCALAGNSAQPGSPHYDDRIAPWAAGEYVYLPLDDPEAAHQHECRTLEPA